MTTETANSDPAKSKPKDNSIKPPSAFRRYGSQFGIIGVGLAMWLVFVVAAPAVFTDIDIYVAFAQTTPQFGLIALALTFVVITGEIDLSFPSIMALGTAAFALTTYHGGMPWYVGLSVAFATGGLCGLLNGFLVAKLNIPSLVITIGTSFLYRGLELVLMNGTGVPLTRADYPVMHAIFRDPVFGFPVQTLWMIGIGIIMWLLLNRTRFGAHVFLVGDNPTSARLMGINTVSVKVRAFVLVGLVAVVSGLLTSFYGYYFWPTTGEGFLLNTIASVFLGGTSVFGGTGSMVGTFVASYIIGAINAGVVSAGINAFYTQLCFGLVIVISVVLQTIIERRVRGQSATGR
ncbi:ABC transporter permease [Denitrobaculum tricleocarpae]|uniref:Autoinducer 2 import system permease protein LsrD n=1 Tax=Denitrobaculum tricleocarpae TaxID=2591009 RepID=A0A545U2B1_9PROT|nr:ABC transporter permease [Denitrobaculum tricleocarpae]TQV83598.1 ABC transporter permease [Denitrobaculum tricleocarpae]